VLRFLANAIHDLWEQGQIIPRPPAFLEGLSWGKDCLLPSTTSTTTTWCSSIADVEALTLSFYTFDSDRPDLNSDDNTTPTLFRYLELNRSSTHHLPIRRV
jgi:hypothetical protein